MKPHLLYRATHWLLILSFAVLPFSCKKELKPLTIDPAFAAYVISFTSGVVSNSTKIQVRLVQEVKEAVPGKELSSNPFSISPGISGKAVWVDKQTIEFIPEEKLESGEIYNVDFALDDFTKVPSELKMLKFRFQVMQQNISYEFNGIEPENESDMKLQKIRGCFTTADVVEGSELEKIIDFSGKAGEHINWIHSKDGHLHSFTLDSVERKEKPYNIDIEWNGKKIGAKNGSKEFEMPGINEFKVIDVKTVSVPKAQIEVYFSDPVSRMQDLDGLFRLSGNIPMGIMANGNIVKLIPTQPVTGEVDLMVYGGIRNIFERSMGAGLNFRLKFVSLKPQVELIGDGVIVPHSGGIMFPFRAVSLSAVDVKIIKIFENNIVQFLQVNQLNETNELKRVGRVVYNQEVQLTSDEKIDYTQWNNFSLDLSKLIETEPGAIYRVEISFRKKHSLYPCVNKSEDKEEYTEPQDPNKEYNEPDTWGYYEDEGEYDYSDYKWQDRDDPGKASYYMGNAHKVARNILASDFGIIAKAGTDNNYFVAVTDLRDTKPFEDVELEFRNLQNQVIGKSKTDADGFCKIRLQDKPFVVIAKKEKERGYLRLDDASSLSLSMFDVAGEELKKGVRGFIYGERGVWRPGDLMYLTFILEDKNKSLPANHPVIMELYNPSGQLISRMVKSNNVNGFYNFLIKTNPTAATGNWSVKMRVGGSVFARNLRIETVKPNRLKINLNFGTQLLKKGVTVSGKLQVNWLHGAPAANAKVKIDATVAATNTTFAAFPGYTFDDPVKKVASQDISVFNGTLNPEGAANVNTHFDFASDAPGMLAVQMKTTAFEGGGDFSTDRAIFNYSPYKSYAGVKIPQGKGWNNALNSDEVNLVPIALVDENGRGKSGKVKIEVYSVYWRWWWEHQAEENLADYVANQHTNLIKSDIVSITGGRGFYQMYLGSQDYGRKLIRITDLESGHSTGGIFYTTYKGWWSNAGNDNPGGAEMLMFQTDKKEYKTGEKITIDLPVTHRGKALISVETGSRVLKNFWFEPETDNSRFSFEATPDMAPNIYIHVTYIQPHNHGKNDFPIRMYGVQSVKVEDPQTHLSPRITMPSEIKPLQKFNIKVDETTGKAMTYTIAVVDEGLLDLTRFKTPNPWDAFYTHEALGVRTWDLYKYVAGAFTGKLAGLYAIGGDQYFDRKGKNNSNRFKPVVLYQGPFTVEAKSSRIHTFTMPNYVGSVRVMVVAGNQGAYGSAEKAVPVRQSLMVLPTLPRVISPTETIKVPVSVFSMNPKVKNVTVQIQTDNKFAVTDGPVRKIAFDKAGEKMTEFTLNAKNTIGSGRIIIKAVSGGNVSTSETVLNIRLPNPPAAKVITATIEPGKSWSSVVNAFGVPGTNTGAVEISRFYPLNLEKRMNYLIQYPHGCIEQVTSAVFPQLFLPQLMDMNDARKAEVESNVKSCLAKLKSYQLVNGGFSYWPGESNIADAWGTNYAGHFMIEAQARGYQLPVGLLNTWSSYQIREANNWKPTRKNYGTDLIQAYRLYTLALAKKPALSAMNLMRETADIDPAARWRLAAAYCAAGKPEIGAQIVAGIPLKPQKREEYSDTYGSYGRDEAMILETLVMLKRRPQAAALARDIANVLSSEEWLSTQTTAYMLLGISKFAGGTANGANLKCSLDIAGKTMLINSPKVVSQTNLGFNTGYQKKVSVTNNGSQPLFIRVITQGVPLMKGQEATAQNLSVNTSYADMKGRPLNPVSIKQGTQFYVNLTVTHPGIRMNYKNLAVSMLFPSGWEILNARMDNIKSAVLKGDEPDYQDIRDDRVYMYFDLAKGQTKTFRVLLQAAYLGHYYLPSVQCEAMYDNSVRAYTKGYWVGVVK
jgi:Large extracellular alpha-helical protein